MSNTIIIVANMNETTALHFSIVEGNGLIHGCLVLIKKDFSSSMEVVFFIARLQKPFVLAQLFSLTNFTTVFSVLEVGLLIRWHALIYFGSTSTSMFDKTGITVLSKLLSDKFSGIPLKTTLLNLPY